MIVLALQIGLAVLVFAGMEGFAWVVHRYVMHGMLWSWHRSHHEPRAGVFELNDLFAVIFAAPAIACFWLGHHSGWWMAAAIGITAYGAVYSFFHDGMVHGRFPAPVIGERFWKPRLQAHRLHHAVHTKEGCVSFGFLWAKPIRLLKAQLSAKRAQTKRVQAPLAPGPAR